MTDRYVDPADTLGTHNVADSGSGGIDAPWRSITYALANCSNGDTIYLVDKGGDHVWSGDDLRSGGNTVQLPASLKTGITIKPYDSGTIILRATGTGGFMASQNVSSSFRWEDIRFRWDNTTACLNKTGSHPITIEFVNCIFDESTTEATNSAILLETGDYSTAGAGELRITNCSLILGRNYSQFSTTGHGGNIIINGLAVDMNGISYTTTAGFVYATGSHKKLQVKGVSIENLTVSSNFVHIASARPTVKIDELQIENNSVRNFSYFVRLHGYNSVTGATIAADGITITKAGSFNGAAAGACVNITGGTNVITGTYRIVSADADSITIDSDATSDSSSHSDVALNFFTTPYYGAVKISSNDVRTAGSSAIVTLGLEVEAAKSQSDKFIDNIEISSNYLYSTNTSGHLCFIGANVRNALIYGNTMIRNASDSNDYGLVVKGIGCYIANNIIVSVRSIYLSGSVGCFVLNNTCYSNGNYSALLIAANQTDMISRNNIIEGNVFCAFNGEALTIYSMRSGYYHGLNRLNRNCYWRIQAGNLWSMNGTSGTTLASLQTAWASWTSNAWPTVSDQSPNWAVPAFTLTANSASAILNDIDSVVQDPQLNLAYFAAAQMSGRPILPDSSRTAQIIERIGVSQAFASADVPSIYGQRQSLYDN